MSVTIIIPDDYQFGPAMQALTEKQQGFVIAMMETGGLNYTRAALAAGYTDNPRHPGQVRAQAHRLAHDEKIQAAIKEESLRRLGAASFIAIKTVLEIADDRTAETKDRLKAAEMIMNRTGLHATSEHKVAVEHTTKSDKETIARIEHLAKGLGLDPKVLLGRAVVDAVFEEVAPVDEDDLSDVL